MRRTKLLSALLALTLCCTVLPSVALAGGGDADAVLEYWSEASAPPSETETTTEQQAEQTKPQPGEAFSTDSEFSTRDLLYDKDTHKQFITVEGRDGNIFYLIIDYDAPVNADEEQYKTYFLDPVDEADLDALLEEGEPAACSCTERCAVGSIHTACPLCAVNMTECVGKEPEPEPMKEEEPPEPEPEPETGMGGFLTVVLTVTLLAGAAVYFVKARQKKPDIRGSTDLDDYDYGDEDEDFAGGDDENTADGDTP